MKSAMLRVLGTAAVAGLLAMNLSAPAHAAGTGLDGTITNQLTGAPVAGAGIIIQHQDGSGWNFANSDDTGHFAFPDADGEYIVQVSANGYVEQWLYGHENRWEADVIPAPSTIKVPLMPIQYGDVAGRVVSHKGGGGIENVNVELRRDGNWVGNARTDTNGGYRFAHVETDTDYTAIFTFPSGQVIWYDGVESEYQATEFAVKPGETTKVDLTRPPVGNLVIRALDAVNGEPIVGYCFYHQDGPVAWNTTCTDDRGKAFVRDLTVGDYSGGGYDPNEVYVNGHFDPVTVTEGDTTTVTVRLEKSVSLHVDFVDAVTGDPVDGACVILADPVRTDTGSGGHCGSQVDLKNLFAQEHFRLFVAPYDHQHGAQWVSTTGQGTGDPAQAKVYKPVPGERVAVTVKLDGAGSVTGVVKDAATGAGLRSVCPAATGPGASYGSSTNSFCTWDGQYTIRDLGPYQWKLAFPAYDGTHAWTWSGDAVNRAAASPVQVVAGETTTLDVSLPATGTVSGTVTVPDGRCLQCVSIVAVDATTGDYAGQRTSPRADGAFTMKGFNTQDVRLLYSVDDGLAEYPTVLHTTAGGAVTDVKIAVPAS